MTNIYIAQRAVPHTVRLNQNSDPQISKFWADVTKGKIGPPVGDHVGGPVQLHV